MERVPFTPEGLQEAKSHLKTLKEVERPKCIHDIEVARAHGDLSENAEYHAAKDRQGFIEAEIRALEDQVARAQIIDPKTLSGDRVVFGAKVLVYDAEKDEESTFEIVSTFNADVSKGRISYKSPIARALIGRHEGDEVEVSLPGGTRCLEIMEVRFE